MEIEVTYDEDGNEYVGTIPEYPEPDSEPQCWVHHSNSCGCKPEEQDLVLAGQRFSTEPPFPPGWRRPPSDDLDLWPRW
ncbi:hypothetical protein AB0I84_22965 [Streptomyces spectabilis]|uniref:hypothetical protein n=1 Tax=Streptomyces spectabilis TaxID=68270 RepID=UPI0033DAF81D